MHEPPEDARQSGTLSRRRSRRDGVEDAHVTARVDGGETPLETYPANRETLLRRWDGQRSDASKPPLGRGAYV